MPLTLIRHSQHMIGPMIVITADQVDSRSTPDLVGPLLRELNDGGIALAMPADRTAGDEIQMLLNFGADAVAVILRLTRTGRWSVGCGIGTMREPAAPSIRESSGEVFIAARSAVDRAKKRATRFALATSPESPWAAHAEALIDLVVALRDRRSTEGWEIYDLLATGKTQAEAAAILGITPQAASNRARAAELRLEEPAVEALGRLLDRLDTDRGGMASS